MTSPPPAPDSRREPAGERTSRRVPTASWRDAAGLGLLALLPTALLGQVTALLLSLAAGEAPGGGVSIGWLYTCAFHGVPIDIEVRGSVLSVVEEATGGSSALHGRFQVWLLTGTAVALVALFVAGRSTARRAGGDVVHRALHGATVAVPYAVALLLISSFSRVTLTAAEGEATGSVTFRPSLAGAFAWPLVVGVLAGATGGVRSAVDDGLVTSPAGRRAIVAARGGWRMLVAGLVLSIAALFVLAALRPDQASAYARRFFVPLDGSGSFALGNHLLALPNVGMLVLAPAMGSCDRVESPGGSLDVACLRTVAGPLDTTLITPDSGPSPRVRAAPLAFLLALVVPAAASVFGGRRAAELDDGGGAAVGALAGIVFALLAGVTAAIGGVRLSGPLVGSAAGWYGPDAFVTPLVALPWGLIGGGLGGAIASRAIRRSSADPR